MVRIDNPMGQSLLETALATFLSLSALLGIGAVLFLLCAHLWTLKIASFHLQCLGERTPRTVCQTQSQSKARIFFPLRNWQIRDWVHGETWRVRAQARFLGHTFVSSHQRPLSDFKRNSHVEI